MYMYSYNLYVRVSSQFLFIYIKFIQIPWVPVYSSWVTLPLLLELPLDSKKVYMVNTRNKIWKVSLNSVNHATFLKRVKIADEWF